MSTFTAHPAAVPPPPPAAVENLEHERVIHRQLRRAGRYVRLVDLASSVAVWWIGLLAFFMAAALVDHLIGLGIAARAVAFVLLVVGSGYHLAMHVLPLLVRAINPAYAARTIEEATPSLKNSIINFLLLRNDRSRIREIVYQAVEEKAARDIAAVPVEATIDRTPLIRAGYVLCGVLALFAAYKVLSPKDPFQTVARVVAPWADIARPSRVQILDVQPGNAEVFHGQTVKISARLGGLRAKDSVVLVYSTADGQTVDRPVAMTIASDGLWHEGTLPPPLGRPDHSRLPPAAAPAGDPFSPGLQQDVTYRIIAGDAESSPYRLRVIAAPTIVVERLEYEFPAYTKKPPQVVREQGDIKALEGTKVTLHAAANQPIKSAWIDFDPAADGGSAEMVPLTSSGKQARGTIVLQLKPDRRTPWHESYHVRFFSQRGQKSQPPILHKIDVIPDLPPEVQLLQPQRLRVEVPEDGQETIEVRALDPDFGLSGVWIEGSAGNQSEIRIDLLKASDGQPPQITVPYAFRPREHKLKAGDELKFIAVAEDNRTSPQTGQPQPNAAKTAQYTLVVTPPRKPSDPHNQQQPDRNAQGASQEPSNEQHDDQPQKSDSQPGQTQQGQAQQGQAQQGQAQQGQAQQGQAQQGQAQQGQAQQGQGQQGRQQEGETAQGRQGEQAGSSQQGQPQQGQQQEGSRPQQGQPGTDPQSAGESGSPQPGAANSTGAGGNPQQTTAAAQRRPGDDRAGQPDAPQSDAQSDAPSRASGPSGASPRRQGKAHDGEAIEEILKELQKKGQSPQSDVQGQKAAAERLPAERPGESDARQQGADTKGGAAQGLEKTDSAEESHPAKGEQRNPGAAKTGDRGAGAASQEKSGSGEALRDNRDRNKELPPDSSRPEQGEVSPPSVSQRQSDSKGGQSGEESGGGKQGAGQSASQEGNDSAGSKTAADQGAGTADQTGRGEAGSKAGNQHEAAGKTGTSGRQPGAGSAARPDEQGQSPSQPGEPSDAARPANRDPMPPQASRGQRGGGSGPIVDGGGDGNRPPPPPAAPAEPEAADAANLEYARRATDMVLRHLRDVEHHPDPELLDKLGWTREDLAEFLRRWEALQKSADQAPEGRRELDEALRSLGLRDPHARKRAGGTTSDSQRDLRDAGNRSAPPSKYRDLFDAFRKGAARSRD